MSPVFRHGGLRLYLLKLLDEAPRHGYDVIRLLQDRFLGVYSPSPGTIYPRLARLEEEGLVTHDVVDGKKVYKITDKGREELNRRFDDLADLEDELSASVRDIAREISRDVRETVRSLRDEFTWAVREAGRTASDAGRRDRPGQAGAGATTNWAHADAEQAQTDADNVQAEADRAQAEADKAQAAADQAQAEAYRAQTRANRARDDAGEAAPATENVTAGDDSVWSEAASERSPRAEDAGHDTVWGEAASEHSPSAEDAGHDTVWGEAASEHSPSAEDAGHDTVWGEAASNQPPGPEDSGKSGTAGDSSAGYDRSTGRERRQGRWPAGGWREWAEWAERRDWREWAAWADQRDWADWAGKQDWKEWVKAGKKEWAAGGARRHKADRDLIVDLERLAAAFARELRGVAWQAEALSEDAVGNLGRILTEALNRIRNEVFRPPGPPEED